MDKMGKIAIFGSLLLVALVMVGFAMAGPKECNNGIDDDGDGQIDLADAGCSGKGDDDESNCGDNVCEGGETAGTCAVDCSVCGNNVTEGNEVCDGSDLGSETCSTQGYDGGSLGCLSTCDGYDTNGCWTNTCSDTDGGYDPFQAGTASGNNGGSPFSESDFCLTGDTLQEYYCSGGELFSDSVNCSFFNATSCSSGVCV